MKKLIASLIILTTLFGSLFAQGGLMSGEDDIRVSKTKWFDIIYPARSEKAAILLYENADRIYEEIGESYGFPPKFRLPVVICPGVEQFNGYMSNGYYNHIVLYDTAMIEDLAVFTDTFLNLFKHECIHAYTFNLKNTFWTVVGKVLGDPMNLNMFIITSGLAEGATVSGESAQGEGRLNDEYSRQMVKQAKIEGHFPDFFDAQGASSIYPLGSFYYFNGAFDEWLQRKYGMEKYAKFWYRCVNVQTISQGKAFKRIYGMKIRDAWKLFQDEYEVPVIASNPVSGGVAEDFFQPENSTYSDKNNAGALYTQMTISDRGIAYLDDTCSKVFFVPLEALNSDEIKPEKLFTMTSIFGMKFSKDGRYLAVAAYDYSGSNVKTRTKIYDMDTGKFFTLPDHGYYEPVVFNAGNDWYVVRKGFETPEYTIKVDKLVLGSNGSITGVSDFAEKKFALNIAPFSFTDLGDGTFVFIKKTGLVYSFVIADPQLNVIKEYEAPKERMTVRYPSVTDDGKLLFSWTVPGTMPRLGSLCLADGTFELQEDDVSGGVYFPVAVPGSDDVVYIGTFYRQNRLFTSDSIELSEMYTSIPAGTDETADNEPVAETEVVVGIQPQASSIPSEDYNPFPYFTRGMFIPLSVLTTNSYSQDFRGSYDLNTIGASYITGTPWDSLTLELDAGYGISPATGAFALTASGNNGTGTASYQLQGGVEFNPNGWKKVTGYGQGTYQYPVGNGWLVAQCASQINFGKTDKAVVNDPELTQFINITQQGDAVSDDKNNYTYWASGLLFGYTDIRKCGSGKYEKGGFSLLGNAYYTLWNNATTGESYYNGMDLEVSSQICIPRLIPINCKAGMGYNLPTHLSVDIFPSDIQSAFITQINTSWAAELYHGSLPVASVGATSLLFGCDIQKSTFIRWLYLNDIQVSASYSGLFLENTTDYAEWRFLHMNEYVNKFMNDGVHYEDYAGVRVGLTLTPNIGRLASYNSNYTFYIEAGIAGIAGTHSDSHAKITIGLGSSVF